MIHNYYFRTFAPFWNILKILAEKLATLHMQLVHTWSDLIKDIVRYNEEQHKRHKSVGFKDFVIIPIPGSKLIILSHNS